MSKVLELIRTLIDGANEYEKKTGNTNPTVYLSRNNLLVIEKSLQRLEAIENANPSEALKTIDFLLSVIKVKDIIEPELFWKYIGTIKQALLKAQEPKQYLKWEDLKFDEDGQETLVLLNGTKYRMYYYKGYDECINLFTEDETSVIHIFEGCYSQDKQFFNDLRLERVEE